jgi:hypothetical protein
MDRPLCESCIHWDRILSTLGDEGGHCTKEPKATWKATTAWCSHHHRFPQYLNFIRGQEQKKEGDEIRKRNERLPMCQNHGAPEGQFVPTAKDYYDK